MTVERACSERLHRQEVVEEFSHEQHADFIALDRALILPA